MYMVIVILRSVYQGGWRGGVIGGGGEVECGSEVVENLVEEVQKSQKKSVKCIDIIKR